MKSKTKKIVIVGGALALLYFLYKEYDKKNKGLGLEAKPPRPLPTKPPKVDKVELPQTPTPTPPYQSPPFIPQSSGSGTGGMVTNNQTVPPRYNPRDYGDIVLGSVDRGGNIRR